MYIYINAQGWCSIFSLSFYGKEQCELCLTSSFVINGNIRQVWNDSKRLMIIIFWVYCPFKFLNNS